MIKAVVVSTIIIMVAIAVSSAIVDMVVAIVGNVIIVALNRMLSFDFGSKKSTSYASLIDQRKEILIFNILSNSF
jgi:hypothetical protein